MSDMEAVQAGLDQGRAETLHVARQAEQLGHEVGATDDLAELALELRRSAGFIGHTLGRVSAGGFVELMTRVDQASNDYAAALGGSSAGGDIQAGLGAVRQNLEEGSQTATSLEHRLRRIYTDLLSLASDVEKKVYPACQEVSRNYKGAAVAAQQVLEADKAYRANAFLPGADEDV